MAIPCPDLLTEMEELLTKIKELEMEELLTKIKELPFPPKLTISLPIPFSDPLTELLSPSKMIVFALMGCFADFHKMEREAARAAARALARVLVRALVLLVFFTCIAIQDRSGSVGYDVPLFPPALLLLDGDVEANPGPPKTTGRFD